jgi:hypothetical protein
MTAVPEPADRLSDAERAEGRKLLAEMWAFDTVEDRTTLTMRSSMVRWFTWVNLHAEALLAAPAPDSPGDARRTALEAVKRAGEAALRAHHAAPDGEAVIRGKWVPTNNGHTMTFVPSEPMQVETEIDWSDPAPPPDEEVAT